MKNILVLDDNEMKKLELLRERSLKKENWSKIEKIIDESVTAPGDSDDYTIILHALWRSGGAGLEEILLKIVYTIDYAEEGLLQGLAWHHLSASVKKQNQDSLPVSPEILIYLATIFKLPVPLYLGLSDRDIAAHYLAPLREEDREAFQCPPDTSSPSN